MLATGLLVLRRMLLEYAVEGTEVVNAEDEGMA